MELLVHVDVLKAYRDLVSHHVDFFFEKYNSYKINTHDRIISVKELLNRAGVVILFFSAILWISVFMYVVFYYTYMPNVTHIRPVHLQIKSCDENMGVCSFPRAHVQLTSLSRLLMASQPYRVKLVMEVPESQINTDLGMFMVCAQMRAAEDELVSSSCRSTMLRHRSKLHHVIRTMVYAPLLVFGFHEEIQLIQVELLSNFVDDQAHPVTDAYVELQSRFVQVLLCELHIEAHVSGLRYVMYYWPKTSALIGICSNLFLVSLMIILSWYHLQNGFSDYIKKSVLKVLTSNQPKLAIEMTKEKTEDKKEPSENMKSEREEHFPFSKDDFQKHEQKEELELIR